MADWSQLPHDLISLMANKLDAVEDFLIFPAVCRSWRFAYLDNSWNPSHRSPLLMISEERKNRGGGGVATRRIFSMCRSKIYRVPIPEAHGCRCWGSSHGWMVTINQELQVFLLNPISRACLNLPPFGNQVDTSFGWFGFISRAYVFKIRHEFTIVAIFGKRHNLGFARYGDSSWTMMNLTSPCIHFANVGRFKDQILGLSMMGSLYLIEFNGSNTSRALYVTSPPENEKAWRKIYLVESLGSLLMVFFTSQIGFRVYKYDGTSSTSKWSMLKDLGECALLVDDYNCISVPASASATGCIRCNRIYYVADNVDCRLNFVDNTRQYMRVFNMEDGCFEIHHIDDDGHSPPGSYISPVWLLPTIK